MDDKKSRERNNWQLWVVVLEKTATNTMDRKKNGQTSSRAYWWNLIYNPLEELIKKRQLSYFGNIIRTENISHDTGMSWSEPAHYDV